MGLGLNGEGPKEIRAVDSDVDGVIEGHASDLGTGLLFVRVEEMDLGLDLAGFGVRVQTSDRVLARDAAHARVLDRCLLAVETLCSK